MTTHYFNNINVITNIQDNLDKSKKIKFNLDNLSANAIRTVTVPNADITLVGTKLDQILINKTIDAQDNDLCNINNTNISNFANIDATKIADGTVNNSRFQHLKNLTSNAVGVSDQQVITNKNLTDSLIYFQNISDNSKKIQFSLSNISTNTTRIINFPDSNVIVVGEDNEQAIYNKIINSDSNTITNISNINIKSAAQIDASKLANGTVSNLEFQYLNGITSNVVGINDIQVLTNKSIQDSTFTIQNNTDISKKIKFSLSNLSSNSTRIISFPNTNSTLVNTDSSQTLSNKILSSPIITSNLFLNGNYIEFEGINEPSNSSSNKGRLYKKLNNDGLFWKPNSNGNEIDLTSGGDAILPLTTKGDMIVHNGKTNARFPIGENNQVLTSNINSNYGMSWTSFNTTLAMVVVRRTSSWEMSTEYETMTFEHLDISTNENILEYDNRNKDRINIKQDGIYELCMSCMHEPFGGGNFKKFCGRIYKNGSVVVAGSETEGAYYSTGYSGFQIMSGINHKIYAYLNNGDYVSVQFTSSQKKTGTQYEPMFSVRKVEGSIQGAQGLQGIKGDKGVVWQSDWETNNNYIVDDVVYNDGSAYICTIDHNSSSSTEPETGGSWNIYWDIFAHGGSLNRQYKQSLEEQNTSVTNFQQAINLTTPNLPNGIYRIGWSLSIKNKNLIDELSQYRIQMNNVELYLYTLELTSNYIPQSGIHYTENISGIKNITIEFRRTEGNNPIDINNLPTTYIKDINLEIWRIS